MGQHIAVEQNQNSAVSCYPPPLMADDALLSTDEASLTPQPPTAVLPSSKI
jgi:hypothetical protein